MKSKYFVILAVCFFVSLVFLSANQGQKPKWKGTIAEEDGVKVIKNPKKPLYGGIAFELEEDLSIGNEEDDNYLFSRIRSIAKDDQGNIYASDADKWRIQKYDRKGRYLQTIGRTAQRDGALEQPMKVILDEKTGFLYVLDRRNIKIFDKEGNYLTRIPFRPADFLLAEDGNIFASFIYFGESVLFRKISSEGKILMKIAEFPHKPIWIVEYEGMLPGDGYLGVEYHLFIAQIDSRTFIYGDSKEYELNIMGCEGKPLYKIRKKAPYQEFSRKLRKQPDGDRLPPHQPFFHSLFTDSEGRIYVQTNINRLIEDKKCDVFSKDGYYLYKIVIPRVSIIIKSGYLYTFETGNVDSKPVRQIKRYKIKNWEQIKTGI